MGPSLSGMSSVSFQSQQTRFESQSYTKFDQNPVSKNSQEIDSCQCEKGSSRADNFDVEALVKQIWGFASSRIAQAQADGASEEDLESLWSAAERGVQQGFGEARDVLESLGELDEALEMKIDSAYGQIMDRLSERSLEPAQPAQPVEESPVSSKSEQPLNRFIKLEQYERQTFALNLTTAEGDEILIRAVSSQSSSAEDLRFGTLSSTRWSNAQSDEYQLIIKGDLNEQETADLDALLGEVNELAAEFYEGDFETAFQMASELSIDGTSLRSLDLSMKEVEVKGAGVYAETAGQPSSLPKGLQPLRAYTEKLIAAQERWAERFDAPREFINMLSNHPSNRGSLEATARHLMF